MFMIKFFKQTFLFEIFLLKSIDVNHKHKKKYEILGCQILFLKNKSYLIKASVLIRIIQCCWSCG